MKLLALAAAASLVTVAGLAPTAALADRGHHGHGPRWKTVCKTVGNHGHGHGHRVCRKVRW